MVKLYPSDRPPVMRFGKKSDFYGFIFSLAVRIPQCESPTGTWPVKFLIRTLFYYALIYNIYSNQFLSSTAEHGPPLRIRVCPFEDIMVNACSHGMYEICNHCIRSNIT